MKPYILLFLSFFLSCGNPQNAKAPGETKISDDQSKIKKASPYVNNSTSVTVTEKSGSIKSSVTDQPDSQTAKKMYPWKRSASSYISVKAQIPDPPGFKRIKFKKNSYEYWLRYLPLRKAGTKVYDYSGDELPDSTAAAWAVIDLDIGNRDLQQCMDTIIRLRAEYLWQRNLKGSISFPYHGSTYFKWTQWAAGLRPSINRGKVTLIPKSKELHSRSNFRKYLTFMFAMTGTVSNTREPGVKYSKAKPGDFFLHPAPSARVLGHAVIILDIAENTAGEKQFLLGQGFTPAQDMHVLKYNSKTAWYPLKSSDDIKTPLWKPFSWADLKRFRY